MNNLMMALQGIKGGIPITAIAAIYGNFYPTGYINAGATTPAGATKTYQWSYCSTAGGTYTNIGGATSSNYYVSAGWIGYYFKVTVTGTGLYSGVITSAASSVIDGTLYWNQYVSGSYKTQGCTTSYPTCQDGNYFGYSVAANSYQAYGSVANANAVAQSYCDSDGQTYANTQSCGNYYDPAPYAYSNGHSSSDFSCGWSPEDGPCCNFLLAAYGIDDDFELYYSWVGGTSININADVAGHGGVYWSLWVANSVYGGPWGPSSNVVYCYYP